MNDKIDLLAVIRHHASGLEAASGCGGLTFNANQAGHVAGDLRKVEGAIAELIEAARNVALDARMTAPEDHYHEVSRKDMAALVSAVNRVRGAK